MAYLTEFSYLMDKTVTCQRNTPTQDASGGEVPSWGDVSGAVNVRCQMEVNAVTDGVEGTMHRRDGVGIVVFAFDQVLNLRVNDRIVYNGEYYGVIGIPTDRTVIPIGTGPYIVKTTIREK